MLKQKNPNYVRYPRICVECRRNMEQQQAVLLEFIAQSRARMHSQKKELDDMIFTFTQRSLRFRAVFDAAWDIVMQPTEANKKKLQSALELADHQWEGFAGCAIDPDPRAEQHRYGMTREERIRQQIRQRIEARDTKTGAFTPKTVRQ